MMNLAMSYDYIVVGAGSAGCVAASRLVSEFGVTVLLLEEGQSDNDKLIKMPAATIKMLTGNSPYIKRYQSAEQPALGGRTVSVPQGCVVGGGSSVNVMAYVRGSIKDYGHWNAASGNAGWGWNDLLPYFKRQEGNQRLDNVAHGGDGPLKVSDHRYAVEAADLFVRTMQRLDVTYSHDFNAGNLHGVGYMQTTTFGGERCSAADAFLRPVLANALLSVRTGAKVMRVIFEGIRAVGVEYEVNGTPQRAMAHREVILAAGAFATPKLLMISGIGPGQHLRDHGIEVLVDSPGVGQNLQDHNLAMVSVRTNGAYGYFGQDSGWKMLRNGLQYMAFKSGPVTSNGAETMAFVNLDDPQEDPNIQVYCLGVLWPDPDGPAPTDGITLIANLVKPRSRGTVRLRSSDPHDDALISPNWLTDPADMATLLQGVKYLRRIIGTNPLAQAIDKEIKPGVDVQSDEALMEYIRRTTDTNYHPVGTCRMGTLEDPMAVLTPDLKVKGVNGLRVIDASMMPVIIGANTNATVMAVADKAVDLMNVTASPKKTSAIMGGWVAA